MTNLPVPVETGLKSIIPGAVRTLVPVVVSLLVGWGLTDTRLEGWVTVVLTIAITAVYYVVVRLLERYWDKIGWLLGYPAQPVYVPGEVIKSVDEPVVVAQADTTYVPEHRADLPENQDVADPSIE